VIRISKFWLTVTASCDVPAENPIDACYVSIPLARLLFTVRQAVAYPFAQWKNVHTT